MDTRKELKILFWMIAVFAAVFFLPLGSERFMTAVDATLDLAKWYAQEHVVLCLLPAFFIAGVIAVFVSQGSVLKYFGANAKKWGSSDISSDSVLKRKTAEQIVYLNFDQQIYSYEQQFSISCLGSLYPQMHS